MKITKITEIRVSDLRVGDVLTGSHQVVAVAPESVWAKPGYVELTLIAGRGVRRVVRWRGTTIIRIERMETAE